jgi:hypothetical protein
MNARADARPPVHAGRAHISSSRDDIVLIEAIAARSRRTLLSRRRDDAQRSLEREGGHARPRAQRCRRRSHGTAVRESLVDGTRFGGGICVEMGFLRWRQKFFLRCGFESTGSIGAVFRSHARLGAMRAPISIADSRQRGNRHFIDVFAYSSSFAHEYGARVCCCAGWDAHAPALVLVVETESVWRTSFLKWSRCFFCSAVVIGVQCTSIRDCTVPISPLTQC